MNNKKHSILYGKNTVINALLNPNRNCIELITTQKIFDATIKKTFTNIKNINKNLKIKISDKNYINHLLPNNTNHQNIALITDHIIQPTFEQINIKNNNKPILILDQITDINNIGAIIRTAVAFGCFAILIPENNFPQEIEKTTKTASGAFEMIPIIKIKNINNIIKILKNNHYWIIGLDANTNKNIKEYNLGQKVAIIAGSEGKGIRELVKKNCDELYKIDIDKNIDSLNVATATAIAIYQVTTS